MSTKAQKAEDEKERRALIVSQGQEPGSIKAKLDLVIKCLSHANQLGKAGRNIHVSYDPQTKKTELRVVGEDSRSIPDSSFEIKLVCNALCALPLIHVSEFMQHMFKYMIETELLAGQSADHFLDRTGLLEAEIGANHTRADGQPAYAALSDYSSEKHQIITNMTDVELNIRNRNLALIRANEIVVFNDPLVPHDAAAVEPVPIPVEPLLQAEYAMYELNGMPSLRYILSSGCRYSPDPTSNGFTPPFTPNHPTNEERRGIRLLRIQELFLWMVQRYQNGNYLLYNKLLTFLRRTENSFLLTPKFISDICVEYERVCIAEYDFEILPKTSDGEIISPITIGQCTFGSALLSAFINVIFNSARSEESSLPYFERMLESLRGDTEGMLSHYLIGENNGYCIGSPSPAGVCDEMLKMRTDLALISPESVAIYPIARIEADVAAGIICLIEKGDIHGDYASLYQQAYKDLIVRESTAGRNGTPSWETLVETLNSTHITALSQMHTIMARSSPAERLTLAAEEKLEKLYGLDFNKFIKGPQSSYTVEREGFRCRWCLYPGLRHTCDSIEKDPNYKIFKDISDFNKVRSKFFKELKAKKAERKKADNKKGARNGRQGPKEGLSNRAKKREKRAKALAAREAEAGYSDSDGEDGDSNPLALVAALKGQIPCATCFSADFKLRVCPKQHKVLITDPQSTRTGQMWPAGTKRAWRAIAEGNKVVREAMADTAGIVYAALHQSK